MDVKERYFRRLMERTIPFFKKSKIPAELLTTFRIMFAIVVAFFFLRGHSILSVLLLTIYQFVLLLDYIDGRLARYQKRFSPRWVKIDYIFHYIISFLFILTLAISIANSDLYAFYAGILCSGFILILAILGIKNFKAVRIKRKFKKNRLSAIQSFIGPDNPFNLLFILFLFNLTSLLIFFYSLFYFATLLVKLAQSN